MIRGLIFLVLLSSLVACQSVGAQADEETGIEGKVYWGPVSPGPSAPGQVSEEPLAASFTVYSGDKAVATFRSDRAGVFRVALAPGNYTIVPASSTPVPRPDAQATRVTVPSRGYVSLKIMLETGMR